MAIVINGSGTVTGLSVGGLPDGTVDAGTVAADVATQAEIDAKANLASPTFTGTVSKSGSSSGTSKVFTTSNTATENWFYIGSSQTHFRTQSDSANRLTLTDDGRGLSQFTAKVWVAYKGTDTNAILDSHNVSSVTDSGTGTYIINFSNSMASANYSASLSAQIHYSNKPNRGITDRLTSSVTVIPQRGTDGSMSDTPYVSVLVFGD